MLESVCFLTFLAMGQDEQKRTVGEALREITIQWAELLDHKTWWLSHR